MSSSAVPPTNAAFNRLVHRRTTLAEAIEAEDHPTNPWTAIPRLRSPNYFKIRATARDLPVATKRAEFIDMYQSNQVIILTSDTGNGKTTQIPQYILYMDAPQSQSKKVVCTQPRRIAAREVSARVAAELDVKLGETVGYSFRHEEESGSQTRLVFATDGRLLLEMGKDPILRQYSCIIIDEAHERTESTDMLLGHLKALLRRRHDLKLVVMSATLRAHVFQKYFDGAPLFHVPGRTYPVDIFYTEGDENGEETQDEGAKACPDYVISVIQTVLYIFRQSATTHQLDGDILVFVPGESDIRAVVGGLVHELRPDQMSVRALHATMTKAEQQRALAPEPGEVRRCIVATNVAETSLTIDGIRHVIDTGLQKGMSYNPRLRLWLLQVEPISQASADQRAGRAGRTGPGTCWRLYSKWAYDNLLIKDPLPGLLRGDMAGPILDTLAIGHNPRAENVRNFGFIDSPSPEVMMRTWYDLQRLGCLDAMGMLTPDGNHAWRIPLEPCHAMAVVRARRSPPFPVYEVAAIVNLLEAKNIFVRPDQLSEYADILHESFTSHHGDHFTLLNIWFGFEYHRNVAFKNLNAADREARLERWCQENYLNFGSLQTTARDFDQMVDFLRTEFNFDARPAPNRVLWTERWVTVIKKVLLSTSFHQIAVKDPSDPDTYRTLEENQPTLVHPASVIARGQKHEFVIYDKFIDQGKPYLNNVTGIDFRWLFEPNTLVSKFLNRFLGDPPPRAERWLSTTRLRLARQRYNTMVTSLNDNSNIAGAA